MKKGIVDPWRVTTPLRPAKEEPPKTGQRINPSDIDLDAELRITQYYVLRSSQGSVRVDSKQIATENDAIKHLVECFFRLVATHKHGPLFKEAGIGFALLEQTWNVPVTPLAAVKTDEAALYFAKHGFEQGMLALVQVLNRINRENRGLLKKYGVSTLLR